MRYQEPSIKDGLNNLIAKGCKEILAVPLYPQYSQSTSLSTKLKIESVVKNIENDVSVNISEPFFRENGYILALKNSIQDNLPNEYDYLLFSYHGIPERHVRKVDPTTAHCFSTDDCCDIESPSHAFCYRHQAFSTSKLCAEEIGLENEKWSVSFQSRIGPGWLTPFTDKFLEQLPKKNIKKLDDEIILRSENWDSERITLMDKLILRLVIAEILFINHVPPKVSIAEGIEIAKTMSTKDSSAFVNGILDSFYNDWKDNKINIEGILEWQ